MKVLHTNFGTKYKYRIGDTRDDQGKKFITMVTPHHRCYTVSQFNYKLSNLHNELYYVNVTIVNFLKVIVTFIHMIFLYYLLHIINISVITIELKIYSRTIPKNIHSVMVKFAYWIKEVILSPTLTALLSLVPHRIYQYIDQYSPVGTWAPFLICPCNAFYFSSLTSGVWFAHRVG